MKQKGFDAIISLCGGLEKDGTPHPWVIRRLDKTLKFYTGRELVILTGGGTPHKPPILDGDGFPMYECDASAKYLLNRGVSKSKILLDRFSMDTIGNAYFTRFLFAEPMRLRNIVVVTSALHMPRTEKAFGWVYGLTPSDLKYNLKFVEAPDDGLDRNIVHIKTVREKKNLRKLAPLTKKIKTMSAMHRFIFFEHGAYAYGKKQKKLRGRIVSTY